MHRLKYIINTLTSKKHLVLPVPSPTTPPPPTPQCRVVQLDSSRYKGVLQSVCEHEEDDDDSSNDGGQRAATTVTVAMVILNNNL